jgi:predicted cupin superfamily sugar epimerase
LGSFEKLIMKLNAQDRVKTLNLIPHPEGGYYQRIYSGHPLPNSTLATATAIHYLLEANDFSAWHRIKQDELWFFHEGSTLMVRQIKPNGELIETPLSPQHNLSLLVPANTWFCAELYSAKPEDYSLVSCVVSPGFRFEDFELANAEQLIRDFPQYAELINRLCR